MPQLRTIKVYKITELEGNARERANYSIREHIQSWQNDDLEEEVFKPVLEAWGFPTEQIEWSLGYCQGDGMAFYGTVDLMVFIKKMKCQGNYRAYLRKNEAEATISRNSFGNHYSHWNTMDVELLTHASWSDADVEKGDQFERLLAEQVQKVSRELEKVGYAHLEVTEEQIEDHCEANELWFLPTGKLAPR